MTKPVRIKGAVDSTKDQFEKKADAPDLGSDFQRDGKYFEYKSFVETALRIKGTEEEKANRLTFLNETLLPLLAKHDELDKQEEEAMLAVLKQYHGSESVRNEHIIAGNKAATYMEDQDPVLAAMLSRHRAFVVSENSHASFYWGKFRITYTDGEFEKKVNMEPSRHSARIPTKKFIASLPLYNVVELPVGAERHHNADENDMMSLKDDLYRMILKILEYQHAEPFRRVPLPTEFPDYHDIIQEPVALGTIQGLLKTPHWWGYGPTPFFKDMLRMFRNCKIYNGADAEITKRAEKLEKYMRYLLNNTMQERGVKAFKLYLKLKKEEEEQASQAEQESQSQRHGHGDTSSMSVAAGKQPETPLSSRSSTTRLSEDEAKRHGRGLTTISEQNEGSAHPSGTESGGFANSKNTHHRSAASSSRHHQASSTTTQRDIASQPPAANQRGRAPRKRPRYFVDDDSEDDIDERSKRIKLTSPAPASVASSSASVGFVPVQSHEAANEASLSQPTPQPPALQAAPPANVDVSSCRLKIRGPEFTAAEYEQRRAAHEADFHSNRVGSDDDIEDENLWVPRKQVDASPSASAAASGASQADNFASSSSSATSKPSGANPYASGSSVPEPAEASSSRSQKRKADEMDDDQPPAKRQKTADAPRIAQGVPSRTNLGFAAKYRPIKLKTLTKSVVANRSWLFAYRSDQGLGVYTIKCPRKTCAHTFREHPLLHNRARNHLQGCGLEFDDDDAMMQDCAQQVIDPDGDGRFTIDWMKHTYNGSIIKGSADKPRLDAENFPATA